MTQPTEPQQMPKVLVTVDLTGTLIAPNSWSIRLRAAAAWFRGGNFPTSMEQLRRTVRLLNELPIGAVVADPILRSRFSNTERTEQAFDQLMMNMKFTPNQPVIDKVLELNRIDDVEVVVLSNLPGKAQRHILNKIGLGGLRSFSTNDVVDELSKEPRPSETVKGIGLKALLKRLHFSDNSPKAVIAVENDQQGIDSILTMARELGVPEKGLQGVLISDQPKETQTKTVETLVADVSAAINQAFDATKASHGLTRTL